MKNKVCVDSNKQCINYTDEKSKELRNRAEKRRELCHYCSLDTLKKILETRALLFNCIDNYTDSADDYERKWIDQEFRDIIFVSCMTHGEESQVLWDNFGDHEKGVKLTFETNGIFHEDLIDKEKYVEGYAKRENENVKLAEKFAGSISKMNQICCDWSVNLHSRIIAEIVLTDVQYDSQSWNSSQNIEGNKCLDLSTVARTVLSEYKDENETRMIAILRSVSKETIEKLSYLLVPLDFRKFELKREYGKYVNEEDKREIDAMYNQIMETIN